MVSSVEERQSPEDQEVMAMRRRERYLAMSLSVVSDRWKGTDRAVGNGKERKV